MENNEKQNKKEFVVLTLEELKVRKTMINYMIEIGDRFKLNNITIHSAAQYIDILFQSRKIPLNTLKS